MARIGSILTVASTLFFEYQLYHWRGRVSPQRDANTSDLHSFFRAELERQLDFHTGICFWSRLASMIPGYVLFCVGFAIAYPAAEKIMSIVLICFFALALLAIPANLKRARTYQRQINELDSPGLS
jgi:hypothetical protein